MDHVYRTVRAIHHHDLGLVLLPQCLPGRLDALPIEIGPLGSPAEDHKAVFVPGGPGDGGQSLFGDTHKVMLRSRCADRVNGDRQRPISAILETDRER